MSVVWRQCVKATIRKQWMSTYSPKSLTNDCQTRKPTMNDGPAPNGSWIARYYLKERVLRKCVWTGFAMLAISLVTLIKTDATWLGRNFQYVPDFKYEDAYKKPQDEQQQQIPLGICDKERKVEKIENVLDAPSSGPFFFVSLLFAITQLTDFFR